MSIVQPAVRKETTFIAFVTAIGVIIMWIAFFVLNSVWPQDVPFNYTIFLGGVVGAVVAVLNFFLMGLTIQKVAATDDEEKARGYMKTSFSRRMFMQLLWIIASIAAPCFQFVAGIAPLFFPSIAVKLRTFGNKKNITGGEA